MMTFGKQTVGPIFLNLMRHHAGSFTRHLMNLKPHRSLFILLFTAGIWMAMACSCRSGLPLYVEQPPPYWPTHSWREATPEEQGVRSAALADIVDQAVKQRLDLHSMQLVRNGYLVADVSFYPYDGSTVHDVASVTKSVTSALIGIAIAKGFIASEDTPVLDFFPEYKQQYQHTGKEKITIRHLVTMTSGLDQNAGGSGMAAFNEPALMQMIARPNWLEFALGLPLMHEPGSTFGYNSCNTHILSVIIAKATGMNTLAFAQKYLFGPLGIKEVFWPEDPQGNNHGWGDLKMHPRDMAKIGLLFLYNGVWESQQIVSPDWVHKSAVPCVKLPGNGLFTLEYSYGWWTISGLVNGIYEANGRGGQHIIVWPAKNTVVVFTGGGFDQSTIAQKLLAALKADSPLAPNPKAFERFERLSHAAGAPVAINVTQSPPALASTLSGTRWRLFENPLGLKEVVITFTNENKATFTIVGPWGTRVWPVGLNGPYAIAPNGDSGLPSGARGSWVSGDEFAFDINEIANINHYQGRIRFDGDKATLFIKEKTLFAKEIAIQAARID